MKVVKQLLKPLLQLSLPLWIDQERDEFRQLGKCPIQRQRGGGNSEKIAIAPERNGKQAYAKPKDDQLCQQLSRSCGRHQGEKHKEHRIGEISFGIELGTLGEHQDKGNQNVQKDAQHQTPGAEISQQKQEGAQEQKPQVPPEGVVLLVSPLEKDGDNRYKNDIRKTKEQVDGTKCCEKKENDGECVSKRARKCLIPGCNGLWHMPLPFEC